MHVYTFKTYDISLDKVEKLTKEECIKMYATHKCDRLPLEEFTHHFNLEMMDVTETYLIIR